MDKLRIRGGRELEGRVRIAGAKNAALPALAASLLTEEEVRFSNVPMLRDVRTMLRVPEHHGAQVENGTRDSIRVQAGSIGSHEAPYDLVKTMRASVLVLGPLLARCGRARVSMPGGCAIGERPIDIHLEALANMGAEVQLEHGYVEARAERLKPADYTFPMVTVTGTENLMMAAALTAGTSVFRNCAQEPEVVDLAVLLRSMGAEVEGAGTDVIRLTGRRELGGASHPVIPDRVEAGTYLMAGALAGRRLEVANCRPQDLQAVLALLEAAGVSMTVGDNSIVVARPGHLAAVDVATAPHPGFPTDMQAQYMTLATQAQGVSRITENIFESRFMHVSELRRLGASINIDGQTAEVEGPANLAGAQVMATDLRASASLVLAGLVADGVTVIDRVYHLDRGYEPMEVKLGALGASVERIK
jgi:UDP-N-acetylglucosamine 1-carboxyvinyltransferase